MIINYSFQGAIWWLYATWQFSSWLHVILNAPWRESAIIRVCSLNERLQVREYSSNKHDIALPQLSQGEIDRVHSTCGNSSTQRREPFWRRAQTHTHTHIQVSVHSLSKRKGRHPRRIISRQTGEMVKSWPAGRVHGGEGCLSLQYTMVYIYIHKAGGGSCVTARLPFASGDEKATLDGGSLAASQERRSRK